MIYRGLFGWSPPYIQLPMPSSEVTEPPKSPSSYMDIENDIVPIETEEEIKKGEKIELPPAIVPFSRLFSWRWCAYKWWWWWGLLWIVVGGGGLESNVGIGERGHHERNEMDVGGMRKEGAAEVRVVGI